MGQTRRNPHGAHANCTGRAMFYYGPTRQRHGWHRINTDQHGIQTDQQESDTDQTRPAPDGQ
ncbi:hypothetical protein DPMN_095785 [Dreissena polymorpha]|uniref:Uncharacterized protein n=1 Tax=Dreissena polymorpha TaxID=45954 RepID=A0A9D4L8L7_DREPO|nr:hypothetical protein DPMN_095785 [Dreissena polymorpha]